MEEREFAERLDLVVNLLTDKFSDDVVLKVIDLLTDDYITQNQHLVEAQADG